MSTTLKDTTSTGSAGSQARDTGSGALATGAGAAAAFDEHAWSELDPLMQFGVRVAGTLFCGVIVLAFFLVPYALLSNGWTPSP